MIISALHQHALRSPSEPAISDGKVSLSYKQLSERTDVLAQWLMGNEIRTLSFQLENGINWVVCDLAAMQAGITIIPVPAFFSDTQLIHVLEDADVDIFVSEIDSFPPGENLASSCCWQAVAIPALPGVEGYRRLNKVPSAAVDSVHNPVPRKITYTSGSTGEPKGVCLPQETINTVASSIVSVMETFDIKRHLCVLPLATLLENIAGLYAPLLKGIEVIAPDSKTIGLTGSSTLDANQFARAFAAYRPHSVILVPQLLMALTTLAEIKMIAPSYLKMIAVGGGRVSTQLIEQAQNLGLPVFEGYGLSECCSVLTLNRPGANRKGSVGKPLPHVQIRANEEGELEAMGAVMSGYLGDALPDHRSNDDKNWIKTGDLGFIDEDGFVYINGRCKHQFITAYGRNVNPEWVESDLTQLPPVWQVLFYGEGREHNLALVWLRFATNREAIEDLMAKVNECLPDYTRVHEFILMESQLDDSFISGNGRLKRALVIKQFQDVIEAHYLVADQYKSGKNSAQSGETNAIL